MVRSRSDAEFTSLRLSLKIWSNNSIVCQQIRTDREPQPIPGNQSIASHSNAVKSNANPLQYQRRCHYFIQCIQSTQSLSFDIPNASIISIECLSHECQEWSHHWIGRPRDLSGDDFPSDRWSIRMTRTHSLSLVWGFVCMRCRDCQKKRGLGRNKLLQRLFCAQLEFQLKTKALCNIVYSNVY